VCARRREASARAGVEPAGCSAGGCSLAVPLSVRTVLTVELSKRVHSPSAVSALLSLFAYPCPSFVRLSPPLASHLCLACSRSPRPFLCTACPTVPRPSLAHRCASLARTHAHRRSGEYAGGRVRGAVPRDGRQVHAGGAAARARDRERLPAQRGGESVARAISQLSNGAARRAHGERARLVRAHRRARTRRGGSAGRESVGRAAAAGGPAPADHSDAPFVALKATRGVRARVAGWSAVCGLGRCAEG
jgi:hypothetical protein